MPASRIDRQDLELRVEPYLPSLSLSGSMSLKKRQNRAK